MCCISSGRKIWVWVLLLEFGAISSLEVKFRVRYTYLLLLRFMLGLLFRVIPPRVFSFPVTQLHHYSRMKYDTEYKLSEIAKIFLD